METVYVICVNDYPVEVSRLDEEGTQARVVEMQERLNAEDGVSWEKGIQRHVHFRCCPVIGGDEEMERGDLVIWKSSTYYGDFRPDELVIVVTDSGKATVEIMSVHGLEEHWVRRESIRQSKQLTWLLNYVVVESFSEKHMEALAHIVGLVNDCEESEREVLEFADRLYDRYAG